jgi:adenosylcobinamide-GDP ribazoletransferase
MSRLFAAIRFLTVVPVPGKIGTEPEDLGGSTVYFGVVGIILGLSMGAVCGLIGASLPDLLTCVIVAIGLAGVSGGLHMDGLSDTADGMFSSRPRERMLEIMRDSRVGAMGVMAIVFLFVLKVSALFDLPQSIRWRTVVLMPVAGRCAMVFSMAISRYARSEGGMGTLFFERSQRVSATISMLLLGTASWVLLEWTGLAASGSVIVLTLLLRLYFCARLGGATGDTLGATCELGECLIPILVCAIIL